MRLISSTVSKWRLFWIVAYLPNLNYKLLFSQAENNNIDIYVMKIELFLALTSLYELCFRGSYIALNEARPPLFKIYSHFEARPPL